jgi:molecular chaperone HtpG
VDEFAIQMLRVYKDKTFSNVCTDTLDLASEEEKVQVKQENEKNEEILKFMQESIGDGVHAVRFTTSLVDHAVGLSTEGGLSLEMERVLSQIPGNEENGPKAQTVLEINLNHPIAAKVKELYVTDKEKLADYARLLWAEARLVSGLGLENPGEFARLLTSLMI